MNSSSSGYDAYVPFLNLRAHKDCISREESDCCITAFQRLSMQHLVRDRISSTIWSQGYFKPRSSFSNRLDILAIIQYIVSLGTSWVCAARRMCAMRKTMNSL